MGTITMQPTFLFAKSSSAFAASSPELLLFFQPLLPLSQQYIFFICLARARPAAPDELLAQHCSVFQSCRPFLLLHLPQLHKHRYEADAQAPYCVGHHCFAVLHSVCESLGQIESTISLNSIDDFRQYQWISSALQYDDLQNVHFPCKQTIHD